MIVIVEPFRAVREAVGAKELSVEVPDGCPIIDLRSLLARDHAVFDRFGERLAVSFDREIAAPAAAPHRGDAFEACRFAIDTLKETGPTWKKEVVTDGAYRVDDRP